jgi:hypothetical protein
MRHNVLGNPYNISLRGCPYQDHLQSQTQLPNQSRLCLQHHLLHTQRNGKLPAYLGAGISRFRSCLLSHFFTSSFGSRLIRTPFPTLTAIKHPLRSLLRPDDRNRNSGRTHGRRHKLAFLRSSHNSRSSMDWQLPNAKIDASISQRWLQRRRRKRTTVNQQLILILIAYIVW